MPTIVWIAILTMVFQPVDFDGDATLFHFHLLRSIGRGAFGKARVSFINPGAANSLSARFGPRSE